MQKKIHEREPFLNNSTPTIWHHYCQIRDWVLEYDSEIYGQINKSMLSLKKKNRGVIWLEPVGHRLKVYFAKNEYKSSYYEIIPDGWGGYPYIKISEERFNFIEIKALVKEAIKRIDSII